MKPATKSELRELDSLLASPETLTPEHRTRIRELLYQLGDLRNEYADLAEANLATTEQFNDRKSTPKFWVSRQGGINETAIQVCQRHGMPDLEKMRCVRLKTLKERHYTR